MVDSAAPIANIANGVTAGLRLPVIVAAAGIKAMFLILLLIGLGSIFFVP